MYVNETHTKLILTILQHAEGDLESYSKIINALVRRSHENNEDIDFGDDGELKRFDAGANFLAGYEFSNKLSFQLNAGLGLVNILNTESGDDAKLKNTGFGISLGYRF